MAEENSTHQLLLIIIAILLPPLAVFLLSKKFDTQVIISIVLTLLFWLPGVLHAVYLIVTQKKS